MGINEDEIVNKIKARDSKGLKILMDMYTNVLYKICYSIIISVGNEKDVEECVQDVFVHIWNNIYDYNHERGGLKTWIMVICKYKGLDYRRKLLKHNGTECLHEIDDLGEESVEVDIISKENRKEIISWVKSLEKTDREIFIKRYFLHESIEDIATGLNLSRGAIDNRLWRGRKKLADYLDRLRKEEIV